MRADTFHKGKYYITIKKGFEDSKRNVTITIDKVYETDSLRILLSDDDDPNFLFILNVNRNDYEDLKKLQGLLISFDNFPAQLVRLLQQCVTNNMFILMQQSNPALYYFEIVEHNEFRRLVHLSLKTGPVSDSDIKLHMAENIAQLKKSLSSVKSALSSSEALWNDKCSMMECKISDLSMTLTKMEEEKFKREAEFQEKMRNEMEKFSQEKLKWQRNTELSTQSQITNMQETLSKKQQYIDDLQNQIGKTKQNLLQLETTLSEKSQRVMTLELEIQKAQIEIGTLKAHNSTMERNILDKEQQIQYTKNTYNDLEKTVRNQEDEIKDLRTSIQFIKQEKANLEERLSLGECLASRNNEAAQMTSEQLAKANQIIAKQNSDIIEMKEKIHCRTSIALEQEKVIERNANEIDMLRSQIDLTNQCMDKLKTDYSNLKEKYETCEKSLKDKEEIVKNNNLVIQWLHKKMEENCIETNNTKKSTLNPNTASSTPYFLQEKDMSQTASDESINFYATSATSNLEDTPRPNIPKSKKTGLDPKYLAPSTDTNSARISEKSSANQQRGKENVNINLPKVDYREKKSAKSSARTQRSTPASAYFP